MGQNDEKLFKFKMGEKVKVVLDGADYIGKIVSRLESHTGGVVVCSPCDDVFGGVR
jgi:hypothetical protein